MNLSAENTQANVEIGMAVEWAPFVKVANVSEQDLVAAASKVNMEFLAAQPGFMKRELVKKSESEYADIVSWRTKEDAEAASSKVESCAICLEYFSLMDMAASEESRSGFAHYTVVKTW